MSSITKEQPLSSKITPSSLTTRSWFRLAMMLPSSISSFFLSLEKSRGSNTGEITHVDDRPGSKWH